MADLGAGLDRRLRLTVFHLRSLNDGEPSMPSRNGEGCRVDLRVVLHINEWMRVEFTQTARGHKIGKARVRQVLANPVVVDRIVEEHDPKVRLLILGDDDTGRAL